MITHEGRHATIIGDCGRHPIRPGGAARARLMRVRYADGSTDCWFLADLLSSDAASSPEADAAYVANEGDRDVPPTAAELALARRRWRNF